MDKYNKNKRYQYVNAVLFIKVLGFYNIIISSKKSEEKVIIFTKDSALLAIVVSSIKIIWN